MTHHSPITDGRTGGMDLTPPVDIHALLTLAILALNTLTEPEATHPVDFQVLSGDEGRKAATLLATLRDAMPKTPIRVKAFPELAVDLLTIHEDTGISLDAWVAGREFVEAYTGPIEENGA